jgi:sulfoxide reductase heme-binding subunit YedZ
MTSQLLLSAVASSSYDDGVRAVSALSARVSYIAMCITLSWGVLSATGWMHRLTGHRASPGGHAVIATFALVTGVVHGLAFLLMDDRGLNLGEVLIPFFGAGQARHAMGIIGLELMIAVGVTAGLKRRFAKMDWVPFHRFAYLAVWLTAMHAWLGAAANGSVSSLWLGGITAIAPAITLTVLRFLPSEQLVRIGLVDDAPEEEQPRPEELKPEQPKPAPSPKPATSRKPATNTEARTVRRPRPRFVEPPTERFTKNKVAEGQVKEQVEKDEETEKVRVSVDHVLCHHYGLCQAQAPKVFRLMEDGRLRYARNPEAEQTPHVRAAAHACPMRAIKVQTTED